MYPSTVAVIFVLPTAFAVTLPAEVIDATPGFNLSLSGAVLAFVFTCRQMRHFPWILATAAAVGCKGLWPSGVSSPIRAEDGIIQRFADSTRTPAISIAVARGGRVVYAAAVGYRNIEDSIRADTATLFRIASVTKPITATAVIRLVEQRRIDLDAPVSEYCPEYQRKRWPVTSRQLLSHVAGVRDYAPVERGVWYTITHAGKIEGSNPFHYHALGEAIRVFVGDSLAFEPGTQFAYSNVGFLLLGCAIEGATGRSYSDAVSELVLRPADMRRTQPADVWRIIPNRAQNYQMRAPTNASFWWWTRGQKSEMVIDSLYNARFEDTSIKLSAGGLMSTAPDLARFGAALLLGGLVQPGTRELMWTEQFTSTGKATGWSLGWTTGADEGHRTVGLNGGQAGVSARLRIYRDDDLVVAAIANRDLVDLRPLVSRIADLWLVRPARQNPTND